MVSLRLYSLPIPETPSRANQKALMKAVTNQRWKPMLAVTLCAFIITIISERVREKYWGPWSEQTQAISYGKKTLESKFFSDQCWCNRYVSFNEAPTANWLQKSTADTYKNWQSNFINNCHANLTSQTCCNNNYSMFWVNTQFWLAASCPLKPDIGCLLRSSGEINGYVIVSAKW